MHATCHCHCLGPRRSHLMPVLPSTGGKGRGKPKSKGQIQKRLAQHQKAVGGAAANQAAAGRPAPTAAATAAARPQTASPLAIKAAEVQGLRLCLMMVVLERARKTAVRPLGSLGPYGQAYCQGCCTLLPARFMDEELWQIRSCKESCDCQLPRFKPHASSVCCTNFASCSSSALFVKLHVVLQSSKTLVHALLVELKI